MQFIGYRIRRDDHGISADFEEMEIDQLTPGEVVIRVNYSAINYKDALAASGKGRILKVPEVNGGIDLAGEVVSSINDRFKPGDRVLACGYGLSESIDGGYAEYARLDSDKLVMIPDNLSYREAMAIGTAGFTAALALIKMEINGQTKDDGPILITGATGGVGSFAINLFSMLNYEVVAMTGKIEAISYLKAIGAKNILDRTQLQMDERALEHARWAGAIDNVGGDILSWITRTVMPYGNIASVGLASSSKLETTVMPFILRAVSILGINSNPPCELRDEIWQRLSHELKPSKLETIASRVISFNELPKEFDAYINASVMGRTIVKIKD